MTDEHLEATISLRGVLFSPRGDVLVVRRATDDEWELPGGRLGPQEDAPAGVRREISEETGLDVDVGRPVHAASWRNDTDRGRFAVYYWCTVSEAEPENRDELLDDGYERGNDERSREPIALSHEHVDYEWLPPESAIERLSDVQTRAVSAATEVYEP
ncbi:NUDIX hydrolase [Halobellus captivus]|uniref:NUDIX hydrolase n=1 Tax=Halobellus captivus TaxID=2592614 RepID=UPI00119F1D9C|nr:NUDIX hydrolase [Halobellus captivus]